MSCGRESLSAFSHRLPYCCATHQDAMVTRGTTATTQEAVPQALILTIGPYGDTVSDTDENDLLTLGTFPLECIPRLAPLALALNHLGLRHKPVVVWDRLMK